ncbi:hypothetical protein TNCV_813901 [Trichonephila clavipes]|nr:hypothetical protein TNCV_813901 [Trichonephila clavipes]
MTSCTLRKSKSNNGLAIRFCLESPAGRITYEGLSLDGMGDVRREFMARRTMLGVKAIPFCSAKVCSITLTAIGNSPSVKASQSFGKGTFVTSKQRRVVCQGFLLRDNGSSHQDPIRGKEPSH